MARPDGTRKLPAKRRGVGSIYFGYELQVDGPDGPWLQVTGIEEIDGGLRGLRLSDGRVFTGMPGDQDTKYMSRFTPKKRTPQTTAA